MSQPKSDEWGAPWRCPKCDRGFMHENYPHICVQHIHQYVIPVEWRDVGSLVRSIEGKTVYTKEAHTTVIKLRCACGEETER